jgi:hypothetical protein
MTNSTLERLTIDQIVSDVFEGLTDLQLMVKYKISWSADLRKVFKRLVTLGVIEEEEFYKRFPTEKKEIVLDVDILPEDILTHNDAREVARNKLFGNVEICDITSGPCSQGIQIKDISEFGLMVAPIKVSKNEARHFLIKPAHLDDVGTIELFTECRWTDGIRAGFKITSASPSNMKELRKFIRVFSFEAL